MHERLIQLDAAALESLYAKHSRAFAAYAWTLTTSRDQAEDLVHEAFASVLGSAPSASMPLAYLLRAIRNKATDQLRAAVTRCKAERSVQVTAREAVFGGGVSGSCAGEDSQSRFAQHAAAHAALSSLSPAAAEVVTLRTRCGLSFPEMAVVLDEPVGTISARYARAIATVREALLAGVNHD